MYAASSASTPCLIRMQRWHVNVRVVNIALSLIGVSIHVLNQTVVTVWFSTALGTSRQMQTKAVCEEWGSGRVGRGRRTVSPCIHMGSNDVAFRWRSQCGGIVINDNWIKNFFFVSVIGYPKNSILTSLDWTYSPLVQWYSTFSWHTTSSVCG